MAYFDENTRVKFPATIQFLRLGYDYQSLKGCEIDINTRIFKERFKASVERINNVTLTDAEVASLITEIHNLIKRKDMGKEFYRRIIQPGSALALVDFENIQNNDFAVVDELTFAPEEGDAFRPDINILINGIPLGFLEVKMPDNPGGIQREFHRMIDERLRKPEQAKFFNLLQFITFSNNMEYEDTDDTAMAEEIRAGSFYSTPNGQNTYFNFFREQKDTEKTSGFQDVSVATLKYILKDNGYSESEYDAPEFQTNLDPFTPCNKFVTSFFEQSRLLYILHYGFCYVDCVDKQGNPYVEKHIMRYPQLFATQGKIIVIVVRHRRSKDFIYDGCNDFSKFFHWHYIWQSIEIDFVFHMDIRDIIKHMGLLLPFFVSWKMASCLLVSAASWGFPLAGHFEL